MLSVDALRGFDMFWIIGGHGIVLGLAALIVDPVPAWLQFHMSHPDWIGFSAWDMIMPLFLFIVGVVMPFSFAKRLEQDQTKWRMYAKVARRTVILFVLGMAAQGNLLDFKLDTFHIFSNTLQAIAVGYLIGAILLLEVPVIGQVLATLGLLLAYWALLAFVPFPGGQAGLLEPQNNLALVVDKWVFGRFQDGTTYTWLVSGLGFAATTMLGVFGGQLLRSRWSPWMKATWITLLGILCLAAGWAWGFWLPSIAATSPPFVQHLSLPIIKHIWTSSMVLWAGGWSFLLLAVFYAIIDVIGWRRWAFFFIVIGANAIAVYMATHVIEFHDISDPVVGGLAEHFGRFGAITKDLCAFAAIWLILWYMYRNKTFVRV